MSTRALITAEEFARMNTAETADYELVDGELTPVSSPNPLHADIRFRAELLIRTYLERNPIGRAWSEIDCRLTSDTVRRPDLSIFLGDRSIQIDRKRIPVPFAPDIAVEVLSPTESAIDVHRKVLDYLKAGSQEVWLLDHANGELFIRTNSGIRLLSIGDVLESPLLPGFCTTVAGLLVES